MRELQLGHTMRLSSLISREHLKALDVLFGVAACAHDPEAPSTPRDLIVYAWETYLTELLRHAAPLLGADATLAVALRALRSEEAGDQPK